MRISKEKGAYAPFLLVIVVGLLYHLRMQPMGGDDLFFAHATDELGLWGYLAHRYVNWTSRVVSEFVLVNVIQVPLIWRAIDFLMFASLPIILSKIFGGGKMMNWCAAGAVLIFPFHDMGTAGWITTTVTHFWPLWGICYIGLLIKKMLMHEKIYLVEAVFGVLACIVTCSHEQYAVILMVLLILCVVLLWMRRKGKNVPQDTVAEVSLSNVPLFAVLWAVNLISLLVIALCPGNAARNAVSIADLPIYAEFGFGEKLYLGLLSIERVFLANADVVFLVVVWVWTVLVYLRTKDYWKTLISGLPALILFGQTVLRTAYPGLSGLFVVPGQILDWSWADLSTWLPMLYLAVAVVSMLYALYQLLGINVLEYIYALILLGCGFGAGMVLGFMATIYVSGERVYAPLYGILLFVTLHCIDRMRDTVEECVKRTGGKLFVTLLAVTCLTNILFIALSV